MTPLDDGEIRRAAGDVGVAGDIGEGGGSRQQLDNRPAGDLEIRMHRVVGRRPLITHGGQRGVVIVGVHGRSAHDAGGDVLRKPSAHARRHMRGP